MLNGKKIDPAPGSRILGHDAPHGDMPWIFDAKGTHLDYYEMVGQKLHS